MEALATIYRIQVLLIGVLNKALFFASKKSETSNDKSGLAKKTLPVFILLLFQQLFSFKVGSVTSYIMTMREKKKEKHKAAKVRI